MLYFIYGNDTYSVFHKAKRIETEFLQAEGDFNLVKIDGSQFSKESFFGSAFSLPFLGSKRLIIIKNFLLENDDKELKKEVASSLKKLPESTDLLFLEEGAPDKRESIFKTLLKSDKAIECSAPREYEFAKIAKQMAEKANLSIDSKALSKLALFTGSDLWRLRKEIEKLLLYGKTIGRPLVEKDIDMMVEPDFNLKIFDLTDALAERNLAKSSTILESFFSQGEDPSMIFNMIIYQFRNLLVLVDLRMRNMELDQSGLSPFVLKKLSFLLKNYSLTELKKIYSKLLEIDLLIKSGRAEMKPSLTLLLVEISQK